MNKFTAPSWDVGKTANALYDNFSEGQKFPKAKRIRKKKNNANNDPSGKNIKGTFKGEGLTREAKVSQVGVKTKKNNGRGRTSFKRGKKFKGNVNNSYSQNYKEGNDKFDRKPFSNKQKSMKNFKREKSDFSQSSQGSAKTQENFSQKEKQNKRKLQFTKGQEELSYDNINFKSSKEINSKSDKKGKNKFQMPNHSGDTPLPNTNSKVKNRKRSASHLLDSQISGQSMKKLKLDSDVSNEQTSISSQKKVMKGKQFPNHKKLNKQRNEVNVNNFNNQNGEMKSPYSGKNRFFDSSLSLRERMLLQLKSSRFRYINEQLYTSDSKDAEVMFKKDPDLFKVYHEGFKQQVEQWPVNPVEKIIKAIQRKPANLVVVDFGCGDAQIAKSVPNKVHSFDLVALSNEVTVCDMAHTPLEAGSADICVFCLSLMGTNLGSYLMEANRILKVKGTLKIAEVASRFTSLDQFVKDMKKYGFVLVNKDLSHDLFYFLNFQKDSNIKKVKGLPDLSLNPCWYKKR